MARSILIIGAGVGGLSAGCYAAMNGYNVRILEMHTRPGGVCTSWTRHGYAFDGCIHNLAGSCDASAFWPVWSDLGVVPGIRMHAYDELVRVERPSGEPLTIYTDLDRLEEHMKRLFPEDRAPIEELTAAARRLGGFDVMGMGLVPILERARLLGALPMLLKYGGLTLEQYAKRFKDPFLRTAFPRLVYDWPKQSMLILLTFLGRCSIGDLGWPVGGSDRMIEAIATRFRDLGGEVRYHTKVKSIIVENDRAVGVKLDDGSEERADIVISNANGRATIFDMLGGRYTNGSIRDYYAHPEDRYEMGVHVSLGLRRDLKGEPHAIIVPLEGPEFVAGEERDHLYVQTFGHDPTMAPKGKSVLKVLLATSYRRWEELARDRDRYDAEKRHIADTVVRLLEKRFPGIGGDVEALDVATPITTLHFTGNAHGYRSSIVRVILGQIFGRRLSQTLPGLGNFYMVGQWAGAPGVSPAAAMGRDVARAICRRDGRPFLTTKPGGSVPDAAYERHAA